VYGDQHSYFWIHNKPLSAALQKTLVKSGVLPSFIVRSRFLEELNFHDASAQYSYIQNATLLKDVRLSVVEITRRTVRFADCRLDRDHHRSLMFLKTKFILLYS